MSDVANALPSTATPAAEVAAPTTETAAAPAPAAEKKPIAREFSVLARKEKALQREREAIKAREAALAAREAKAKEIEEKWGTKPESPRQALERYGYTYNDAAEYELHDGAPSAETIARQAVEEAQRLRQEIEDDKKRQAEEHAKNLEADAEKVVAEFRAEVTEFITSKPDDYELIALFKGDEVVYQTVAEHFTKSGRLLDLKEAADLVEAWLQEQVETALSTRKFKAKRQLEASEASKPSTLEKPGQVSAQRRTITNDLTSSTPTLVSSSQVETDRMKRALAALG